MGPVSELESADSAAGYEAALEAVIRHLEGLESRGVRHVPVARETLLALSASAPAKMARVAVAKGPAERPRGGEAAPPHAGVEPPLVETKPMAKISVAAPAVVSEPPLPPLEGAARVAAMAELHRQAEVCVKCPHLAAARKKVVFGVGDIFSPVLFVGEAPGADEDEAGEPFVGRAGQLLTKIIETMGFSRQTVYIANILKCRPDTPGQASGNRKPRPEEMKTCFPYLEAQIRIIQPRVMVALGATAVEGLLGATTGITKLRGHWQVFRGIPLMPTYHPAYLLRNQSLAERRKVWEDMLAVLEKLGRPITEKQRRYFTY